MKRLVSLFLCLLLLCSFAGCKNKDTESKADASAPTEKIKLPVVGFVEMIAVQNGYHCFFKNGNDNIIEDFVAMLEGELAFAEKEYTASEEEFYIELDTVTEVVSFKINSKDQIHMLDQNAKSTYFRRDGVYETVMQMIGVKMSRESQYYSITQNNTTQKYEYKLTDASGKTLESGESNTLPHISRFSDNIAVLSIQEGADKMTRSNVFFNLESGEKSPVYYGQVDCFGNYVSYTASGSVKICDMFTKQEVKVIDKFEKELYVSGNNIASAYFVADGTVLDVYYYTTDGTMANQAFRLELSE